MRRRPDTPSMPHTVIRGPTTGGTILVVDDQAANVRVVGALLGRNGYEVMTASSGPEALAAARTRAPDLILLAIPPLLSGADAGVRSVDPAVRDAAYGMGMTGREVLWLSLIHISEPTRPY